MKSCDFYEKLWLIKELPFLSKVMPFSKIATLMKNFDVMKSYNFNEEF